MASAESVGETNTYKLIKIEGGGAVGFPIEIMNKFPPSYTTIEKHTQWNRGDDLMERVHYNFTPNAFEGRNKLGNLGHELFNET